MPADDFETALLAALPALRRRAQKLTNRREAAEDLVQDAMLVAWAARERFTPGTNMAAWCMTILRNRFLSLLRNAAVRPTVPLDDIHPHALELSVPAGVHWTIATHDAAAAFDGLAPHLKDAMVRIVFEGASYEDAAATVGVAKGTMKTRVFRAREKLMEAAQL